MSNHTSIDTGMLDVSIHKVNTNEVRYTQLEKNMILLRERMNLLESNNAKQMQNEIEKLDYKEAQLEKTNSTSIQEIGKRERQFENTTIHDMQLLKDRMFALADGLSKVKGKEDLFKAAKHALLNSHIPNVRLATDSTNPYIIE